MLSSEAASHSATVLSISIFIVVALLFQWFAKRNGLYRLPKTTWNEPSWQLRHILTIFIIYILVMAIIPNLALTLLKKGGSKIPRLKLTAIMQWVSIAGPAIFLTLVCAIWMRKQTWSMWKSRQGQTFWGDIGFGILYWALSLPVVFAVNQFFEMMTSIAFDAAVKDQVAVLYLRSSMASPFYFATALIAIVIAAPFIEEFIFRCCLQGYLRKHIGSKSAILVTALVFSLFHYATAQGFTNIPILTSLFTLAIYLGWVFEKRQSLWASIGMHMTFNAANVGYILTTMEKVS
ncbi:MAG: type II CAAX endopeptidase family protein [Simkaniaceae bacterium]|nr:type II CAAX endopeptidase family protein [Simkaniaceae bacterium]